MYVEQRTYTLTPGGTAEYVRLYKESGRQAQERLLGPLLGCYMREFGELNQLVYLWSFVSLEDRTQRRTALMADPDFAAFRKQVRHLVVRQENTLLMDALA